ncbi:GTP 3',8-cyclase MoaA [Tatumella saanichensis]|uniref:GTP 3',8-cyclase MoaA n=1 Tax=Tatumella saanichensis TaxID=480813 RepID=UPI0004A4CC80|nr:GTP 3',8-cyclase MoaA [Tatumella saanichensis]
MSLLTDKFNRRFYYLRLSITDVCNFRCSYCLPDGYRPGAVSNNGFLSVDEIRQVSRAFVDAGTEKIRLTGGEPTLRRDFTDIIAAVKDNAALKKIAMTTNGYRLQRGVRDWQQAGLSAVNISIDSLDARQFHAITGQDKLPQILAGIDACFEAGLTQVKINTVLMKEANSRQLPAFLAWIKQRPIQLRFIELMETGEGGALFRQQHISGEVIRQQLLREGWQEVPRARDDGPARVFSHEDYLGTIGLIMPYSKDFCLSCNRLRVSALGNLHLCLFGDNGIPLRDLLADDSQQPALQQRIHAALGEKKQTHFLHQGHTGHTQNLSFIGG